MGTLALAVALLLTACGGNQSSNATLVMASSGPWTQWQWNPWTTVFPGAAGGFIYLPLAVQDWPNLTSFTPMLASSWSVQGDKLLVKLQPNARWQNGQPVTSTDLIDTLYLYGADGAPVWADIASVSAAGQKEVALTLRKGVPMVLLENNLFNGIIPFPSSVWGKYVTPSLKADVIAYNNLAATDPNAAASSAANQGLAAVFQKVAKVAPSTPIGDGPYKLAGITTQEVRLIKWDGYYDAKSITIPQISFLGLAQPDVNAQLLSGRADFSSGWLYMPPTIVQRWNHTQDAHLLSVPGTFQAQVIFNDTQYPFTDTTVRQALAYAFPLQKMNQLAWGNISPHAVYPQIPDGLTPKVADQFLTQSQLSSLNTYSYDPSKADQLLTSAGFQKKNGEWYMPNGKQLTLALSIDAAWTDQVAALKVAASTLSSIGIQSTLTTVEDATYVQDLHSGNFQVATYCCAGGSPDPLTDFAASPMGSLENYTTYGNNKGQHGIGFGPTADVPGLGTVNVPETLDAEANGVGPGSQMKDLTWDWAKFVNQQVPYLQYTNFANQIAYSTSNFDWPKTSNQTWVNINSGNYAVILEQENGSLHPK
ncbi:MAG TPA: ABC transporter substrate-binding protein [Candidatus Dormibacteraeota bacterium]|nr:ABC transporter substrate-binding protein [Candidatus Dormibacteraeota bacterium]